MWYQDPNKGEIKYYTFLILSLFGCYILMSFIRSICLGMCYRYTYIHVWIRWVITWKLINLMAHIYSGSRLCPGLQLRSTGYYFQGLIITRPTRYFRYQATASEDLSLRAPHDTSDISTNINMTSYRYQLVSPTQCKLSTLLYIQW